MFPSPEEEKIFFNILIEIQKQVGEGLLAESQLGSVFGELRQFLWRLRIVSGSTV
jgi:hypothetical protein